MKKTIRSLILGFAIISPAMAVDNVAGVIAMDLTPLRTQNSYYLYTFEQKVYKLVFDNPIPLQSITNHVGKQVVIEGELLARGEPGIFQVREIEILNSDETGNLDYAPTHDNGMTIEPKITRTTPDAKNNNPFMIAE